MLYKSYIASNLKRMNRRTVYQLLLATNKISKAEISRQTGISAPTVIKIIDYFKEIGCVEESGEGETTLGRKPQMLRFNPHVGYAIGVEFNGVNIKAGIVDFAGNVCYLKKTPIVPDFNYVIGNELTGMIEEMINKSEIPRQKIKSMCIGVPGVVNTVQKTIEFAPLFGITECVNYNDIIDKLANQLKMSIIVENDANSSAMGEFITREVKSDDDLLFIKIGKGLGAGIILNGKLRTGKNFICGEIGYMVFDENFVLSKTQAGWLEKKLDLDNLRKSRLNFPNVSLEVVAKNLALAITNICLSLDITRVVLDRIRDDEFDKTVLKKINYYLKKLCVVKIECQLPICNEPGIVGCANIATKYILNKLLSE